MFNMKFSSSLLAMLLLLVASTATLACGAENDGSTEATETLSLQQSILLDVNANFNQYKQKHLATINNIAEELKLENFKITSSDMSVSRSTQMLDKFDVYFSASLSYAPNDKAFTTFVKKMNLMSASQYVYEEPCGE